MTTITINQDISFSKTKFDTFAELIEEVEDFAFGKIIFDSKKQDSFDISLLEKKYLGK